MNGLAVNATRAFKYIVTAGAIVTAFAAAVQAHASVVIASTRVIYNQREPEVTVKLSNVGNTPALVQTWIDNGDPKASPSSIDAPFTVTPPTSRIDPGKGQTLRIIQSGEPLAADRESVYWLDVLEIPPKPAATEADGNHLQLAFRSRIKLFYRPEGLKGSPENAPAQLSWHLTTRNGHPALEAHNASAYHVSLTDVAVIDGKSKAIFDDGDIVAPGETKLLPLKGSVPSSSSATVRFHTLNDYGGAIEGEAPLR